MRYKFHIYIHVTGYSALLPRPLVLTELGFLTFPQDSFHTELVVSYGWPDHPQNSQEMGFHYSLPSRPMLASQDLKDFLNLQYQLGLEYSRFGLGWTGVQD